MYLTHNIGNASAFPVIKYLIPDEDNRDLHSDDEDHLVELDWAAQSSRDVFRGSDSFGGYGGVAALQERWFPGFVV